MVLVQPDKIIPLVESWSATAMIECRPQEVGRLVMKSIDTVENGNAFILAAIGISGGMVGWVLILVC